MSKALTGLENLLLRFETSMGIKEFNSPKPEKKAEKAGKSKPEAAASAPAEGQSGEKMSKNALKKAKKEKKKAEKKGGVDARKARKEAARKNLGTAAGDVEKLISTPVTPENIGKQAFGCYPLNQSSYRTERTWTPVSSLSPSTTSLSPVTVRGRIHTSRQTGKKMCFLLLRDAVYSVQAVAFADGKDVTSDMIKFMGALPLETIVDVEGDLCKVDKPITSATQSEVEIQVKRVYVVAKTDRQPPFTVDAASKPLSEEEELSVGNGEEKEKEESAAGDSAPKTVGMALRLDTRVMDLRVPANQGIFRIRSAICQYFRQFLSKQGFVEIQTPKLIGAASEGGAAVFRLKYFGRDAFLAQSPQLYKQMACACASLGRVFEIGPVFRAEDSNTHRHLCEFTGLDLEMTFSEHYHEVLTLIHSLMTYIFDNVYENHSDEIAVISQQYPCERLAYTDQMVRLEYPEAVELLRADGMTEIEDFADLDTPTERRLGGLVKKKYGTDFYCLDKFPLAVRPFYTMPDPKDGRYSNSYDWFMRSEEICSGAQRIHDEALLTKRAHEMQIPIETVKPYIESFGYAAFPHAGGGLGLDRVVMLLLGLHNVRRVSMFPRDPKRLTP